jgi:hypothetical protein
VSVLAGVRYQRRPKPERDPNAEKIVKDDPSARDEPPPLATLRGTLTDESGAPLPDATVLLNAATGEAKESVSQGDGSYVFEGLKPGKVTLSVTAPGFQPHMWEVDAKAPLTQVAAQQLSATTTATGSLRCLVRSFQSEPLKANVVVRDARGRKVASGTTDAAGLWEYPLPPGEYKVVIDSSGYQSRRSNVRVAPNEVAVLNIDLRGNR